MGKFIIVQLSNGDEGGEYLRVNSDHIVCYRAEDNKQLDHRVLMHLIGGIELTLRETAQRIDKELGMYEHPKEQSATLDASFHGED